MEPVPPPPPVIGEAPEQVRGFQLRVELLETDPPVWRRLLLPGELRLPLVHDAIQAAMGWQDCHLHRFFTGREYTSPHFVTHGDIEDGDDGVLEDHVRLDQVLGAAGDYLWYEYDFGDSWRHEITVEAVLEEPLPPRCLGGERACPPEDVGGTHGYEQLAVWARAGRPEALLPEGFTDREHAENWLRDGWDPDQLNLDEINAELQIALAPPAPVSGELAILADRIEKRGIKTLRRILARPAFAGTTKVTDEEAERMTEPYRVLLEAIGDGVKLTQASYLPPAVVAQIAAGTGVQAWWYGPCNREDMTAPVAAIRDTARTLGLVTVRNGRLNPTAAARKAMRTPAGLWQHITTRLPAGTKNFHRDEGWLALAVIAAGTPVAEWNERISDLMFAAGWVTARDPFSPPPVGSPTMDVITILAGMPPHGSRQQARGGALAATARAAITNAGSLAKSTTAD